MNVQVTYGYEACYNNIYSQGSGCGQGKMVVNKAISWFSTEMFSGIENVSMSFVQQKGKKKRQYEAFWDQKQI